MAKAFIDLAMSGFNLEFSELREYTYGFFASLAIILGLDTLLYSSMLNDCLMLTMLVVEITAAQSGAARPKIKSSA